jgi:hypothetical protein
MNATDYTIGLAAALKAENLTHAQHNLMVAVARAQESRGFATTPQVSLELGVSFNAVRQHLLKTPDLFEVRKSAINQLTLTGEAVQLLHRVSEKAKRYANRP